MKHDTCILLLIVYKIKRYTRWLRKEEIAAEKTGIVHILDSVSVEEHGKLQLPQVECRLQQHQVLHAERKFQNSKKKKVKDTRNINVSNLFPMA